ncbi:MAG: exodeoxyribonuclease VII small subunit [Anaerolineaceae bacterium]|nr:exodeoxyribonuclease VII small subunit [Anaerolineaceae bacterium]
MAKEKPVEELSYEAALRELEMIVSELEEGNKDLESSLKLYERGQLLSKRCAELLGTAELKIRTLNTASMSIEED